MISFIKNFVKALYYAYMGMIGCGCSLLLLLAFILMSAGIGGISAGIRQHKPISVPQCGLLAIDLSAKIDEAPTQRDRAMNFINGTEANIGILDLSEKIRAASGDSFISGILLTGSFSEGGNSFQQASELRSMLENFKASGKPVYAYLENPTQTDYYLASVATKIYANPAGTFEFKGVRVKSLFIGNALKKYGVGAELIRAGKYKSAGEFFTSDKFSPESREAYSAIADGLWENMLSAVSKSRKIPSAELKKIAEQKAVVSAPEAVRLGLADTLCPRDIFEAEMAEFAGEFDGSFSAIPVEFYAAMSANAGKSVAVLFMDGQIVEGDMRKKGFITSDFYASVIRGLRDDSSVKGVVLRINSPGGSAYASEILRREIELLAAQKPVVASYGSTAASGAYWISAGADRIVAGENTLTGSIGVFGMLLEGRKLGEDFGLTFDSVETSPLADIMSGTRPMTEKERGIIQSLIDKTYADFLQIVSKGRKMPLEKVEQVAQGRVWLASASKGTGLFDEIGGLDRALAVCATLAGLPENTPASQYPAPETLEDFIMQIQGSPLASVKRALLPGGISESLKYLDFQNPVRAQSAHIIKIED